MKKHIIGILIALVGISAFSGCNSEQEPSELDLLIENLPTSNLTEEAPENSDADSSSDTAEIYKSVTGSVVSVSEDGITVSAEGKEHKFIIDENTKVLGGTLETAINITVSYNEAFFSDKNYIAEVITVLSTSESSDEGSITPNSDENTQPVENTGEQTD